MKIDPNDPKLTAYALGELDEAERAAVERELIRSDAAQTSCGRDSSNCRTPERRIRQRTRI